MSVLNDILLGVAAKVTALSLTLDGDALAPVVRKLPKKEEGLDPARQLTVSKNKRPEEVKPFAWTPAGQVFKKRYWIDVVLIAPNNGDQATDLDSYAALRQSIEGAFQPPFASPLLPGVATCVDLDVLPNLFLPGDDVDTNYDYVATSVQVTCIE